MNDALQKLPSGIVDEAARSRLDSAAQGFTAEQLLWASGYFAGLARRRAFTVSPAPAVEPRARLTILYGSQTGNGRKVAEGLQRSAIARGLAVELFNMADYASARLKRESLLAVVVSTHGEGDPPDDALELDRFLASRRVPSLESLRYSVLALGDSSYENFCQTGRDFDARLAAAGAQRLAPLVECDLDFAAPSQAWSTRLLDEAEALPGRQPPAGGPLLRVVPPPPRYSGSAPFQAAILVNQRITGRGSTKDVRHLELDLKGSALQWQPGDALGVQTRNPDRVVEPLLEALGMDGAMPVDAAGGTLYEELATRREVTVVNRHFLDAWASIEPSGKLAAMLVAAHGGAMGGWLRTRQVIDVVREFPAPVAPEQFVAMLRALPPRLYSIASAQEFSEDEVHLTVALVNYEAWGRPHWGAGSSWLSLDRREGEPVPVFLEPNERFRLPANDDAPVIMIGPGTGVAPFRAFLQAREARGAGGRNWLLFGERNFSTDFLYQAEWLRHRKQGLLSRLDVAFSRDAAAKCYVQHRMLDSARLLWSWLEDGGHLYVCGDASRMAADVDRALRGIVAAQGGLDEDGVEDYLAALRRAGRYQRDVY